LEAFSQATDLEGLGPSIKEALAGVFGNLDDWKRSASEIMGSALEMPGVGAPKPAMATAGGEAGFYDVSKAPVDVPGLAKTVEELKGALGEVRQALSTLRRKYGDTLSVTTFITRGIH